MSNAENTPMVLPTSPDTINAIFQGAKFNDYHQFSKFFGAYQERTHTVYKVDGSELLKDANNPDLVKKYKYDYVVFECQHGPIRRRVISVFINALCYPDVWCANAMGLQMEIVRMEHCQFALSVLIGDTIVVELRRRTRASQRMHNP
uniref:SnoaL-like domain-containing protein n=1 Tax=Panagrellus redivivus TaxID=6233 RepID=A0A7E4VFL3_PANRE